MPLSNHLRFAAAVLALPAALAYAAPQSTPPHMEHSAPFLGQTLTIRIEGAPALAAIDLLTSPEAGSFPTPYGLLELRRDRVELFASGVTTAAGTWSFDLPVPLDPALAEDPVHFQALIDDPSTAAGKIFSDAVHARFLGPRVYAGYRSEGSPHRIGMYILSAVTDEVVARVDYGLSGAWIAYRHEGKPVFDAAFSRGAVMSTDNELLFFDPFFGGVQGRIAFASSCSRTVFTDAARRTVYVLEVAGGSSPARVHAIDLSKGAETAHLDLPNVVETIWCLGRASSEVFVAEHEPDGRTAIRWVGLDPLADRGSVPVGAPGENFTTPDVDAPYRTPMVYAASQVFVSTSRMLGQYPWVDGTLTRCRATPSGITTRMKSHVSSLLAAVPAADRLLACTVTFFLGGVFEMPLSTLGPPTYVPGPPSLPPHLFHEVEADGKVAWMIGEWEWDHSDILYRLDLETYTWTQTPYSWPFGRNDAEVLRDAWNHELWVSNRNYPGWLPAGIRIVDELHGTSRHIALGHTPEVLHAVPLP